MSKSPDTVPISPEFSKRVRGGCDVGYAIELSNTLYKNRQCGWQMEFMTFHIVLQQGKNKSLSIKMENKNLPLLWHHLLPPHWTLPCWKRGSPQHFGLGSDRPTFGFHICHLWLCELGQITWPLWASASPFMKQTIAKKWTLWGN